MRLTRRDAVAALATLGVGTYTVGQIYEFELDLQEVTTTMLSMATLVYPSVVDVDEEFVGTYVLGRSHAQQDYRQRVTEATSELNQQARHDYGRSFSSLSPDHRRAVLQRLGVNRSHSDPDGLLSQRIRYYVVNDLLYALYTTPVGGRLFGSENPPGYPGGREAYQHGPEE